MTKLSEFIKVHRWIASLDMEQACDRGEEVVEKAVMLSQYINEMGDNAEQVILQRISEEEIAEALNSLAATLVSAMFLQGKVGPFMSIVQSDEDTIQFIHTLAIAFVGMLMDEEII